MKAAAAAWAEGGRDKRVAARGWCTREGEDGWRSEEVGEGEEGEEEEEEEEGLRLEELLLLL